jgi:hypothetical protein
MADIPTTPDGGRGSFRKARSVMSGKRSKPDGPPRMLLDGRSPEDQKAILEDMNGVMIRHRVTSTATGTNELHVVTMADFEHAQVGAKSVAGAKKGGNAKAGSSSKLERDIELAWEFQRKRAKSGSTISDTALMERIGSRDGLKRSAAIAAIKRGLAALPK